MLHFIEAVRDVPLGTMAKWSEILALLKMRFDGFTQSFSSLARVLGQRRVLDLPERRFDGGESNPPADNGNPFADR